MFAHDDSLFIQLSIVSCEAGQLSRHTSGAWRTVLLHWREFLRMKWWSDSRNRCSTRKKGINETCHVRTSLWLCKRPKDWLIQSRATLYTCKACKAENLPLSLVFIWHLGVPWTAIAEIAAAWRSVSVWICKCFVVGVEEVICLGTRLALASAIPIHQVLVSEMRSI